MAPKVTLKVDGKDIGLSDYPEKIVFAVTAAAAETLRGVEDDWKRIELVLER